MTIDQAKIKANQFYNWFLEVRKEFPQVKLQENGTVHDRQIYFIGNKSIGDDYSVNCWKQVPIYKVVLRGYTLGDRQGQSFFQFFLDTRLNFRGSFSSSDFDNITEDRFKELARKSFKGAIEDFLIKEV